ncbi:hypothetical protein WR25_20758 isoform B [Diploscapter pachys]|uniref:Piwi domain-containing protein n=1 Tax=Diploscapter pachys TaxID=2018661 RepID=A0A2A2LZD6_9BILA|nr:hypothetical protein WR25_20758 isoform B [Diploscapter pachys]
MNRRMGGMRMDDRYGRRNSDDRRDDYERRAGNAYNDRREGGNGHDQRRGSGSDQGEWHGSGGQYQRRGGPQSRLPPFNENRQREQPRKKGINIARDDLKYQGQTFVKRPETKIEELKLGRKIDVTTNYVKLELPETPIRLYQYNVEILMGKMMRTRQGPGIQKVPVTDRTQASKLFHRAWTREYRDVFPSNHSDVIFNDVNILWSAREMNPGPGKNPGDFTLELELEWKKFWIHIVFAKSIEINRADKSIQNVSDLRTVLDAMLSMRLKYELQGNDNCVTPTDNKIYYSLRPGDYDFRIANSPMVQYLSEGVETWTGLHGAVKPECQAGVLYNVDLSHSLFYSRGKNLLDFLVELLGGSHEEENVRHRLQTSGMPFDARKKVESAFKGLSMYYQITPKESKKYFKFTQLSPKGISQIKFVRKDLETGEQIEDTVLDYLRKMYGYSCNYRDLPAVVYKKNMFVPLDRCFLTDIVSKYEGRVKQNLLGQFIRKTAMTPDDKLAVIKELVLPQSNSTLPTLLSVDDMWLKNFGVTCQKELMQLKATILPAPSLKFGEGSHDEVTYFHDRGRNDGIWELVKRDCFRQTLETVNAVMCVIYVNDSNQPTPQGCVFLLFHSISFLMQAHFSDGASTLIKVLREMGLRIHEEFETRELDANYMNPFEQIRESLEGLISGFKKHVAEWSEKLKEPIKPIVLFILNGKFSTIQQRNMGAFNLYQMIKYYCDVVQGVYAQVILRATYNKMAGNIRTAATAHNVALKVLAKLGVSLFHVDPENHKNWAKLTDAKDPTLVLSVDVTHPSADQRIKEGIDTLSVASVVGNLDVQMTKFGTNSHLQRVGEEQIVHLDDIVCERIRDFERKTGSYPNHLVVYRDGVSETEFKRILFEEKAGIMRACSKISEEFKPTLTYIVATKRHHTHFFPNSKEDSLA